MANGLCQEGARICSERLQHKHEEIRGQGRIYKLYSSCMDQCLEQWRYISECNLTRNAVSITTVTKESPLNYWWQIETKYIRPGTLQQIFFHTAKMNIVEFLRCSFVGVINFLKKAADLDGFKCLMADTRDSGALTSEKHLESL